MNDNIFGLIKMLSVYELADHNMCDILFFRLIALAFSAAIGITFLVLGCALFQYVLFSECFKHNIKYLISNWNSKKQKEKKND